MRSPACLWRIATRPAAAIFGYASSRQLQPAACIVREICNHHSGSQLLAHVVLQQAGDLHAYMALLQARPGVQTSLVQTSICSATTSLCMLGLHGAVQLSGNSAVGSHDAGYRPSIHCMPYSRAAAQGHPVVPAKFVQQLCLNLRAPPRPPKDLLSTVWEPFGPRTTPHTFLRPKKRRKDPKRPSGDATTSAAPSAAQAQTHALPGSGGGLDPATEAALDASEEANPAVSATARKLPGVVADAQEAAGEAAAQAAEVKRENKRWHNYKVQRPSNQDWSKRTVEGGSVKDDQGYADRTRQNRWSHLGQGLRN